MVQQLMQLRFQVKTVVEDRVGTCHRRNIIRTGSKRVWIDARAAQQFDLRARTIGNPAQRIGQMAGCRNPLLRSLTN